MVQLKRQITFSLEETQQIREAFAEYVASGGEKSINIWMKEKILKELKK